MKKQTINYSWPASLSGFTKDTVQENFSRGKLKVFYKGETADHRYFSDTFSEQLICSLPYTPVVSYYDEEKDDFVGHATEQQILGIVDPCSEPSFEKDEDGTEWCVCDVVLYTERPDKVGDIAKKIEGHSQSLELDPSSVKYTINYDERKHFKNIEFTEGRFVGVSVLGKDQKPAFTGSTFFASDEKFSEKMSVLKEYCENAKNDHAQQQGGMKMNLQEFMTLSWGEISHKVDETICKEYAEDAWTQIIDMFDDSAIVRCYFYLEETMKLMRIRYTIDESGQVQLGGVNEVRITYEDVEQATSDVEATTEMEATDTEQVSEEVAEEASTEAFVPCKEEEDDKEEEELVTEMETAVEDEEKEKEDETQCEVDPSECTSSEEEKHEDPESNDEDLIPSDSDEDKEEQDHLAIEETVNSAQSLDVETTPVYEKVSVDNDYEQNCDPVVEEASSSTSFTESERAEFEALKREKKITLVDSYKETLSDEEYADFVSRIDEFDETTLELELLKKYKANASRTVKPMRAFAFAPTNNATTESSLDSFVRKYKN